MTTTNTTPRIAHSGMRRRAETAPRCWEEGKAEFGDEVVIA
jgi:hypothetical protein